MRPRDGDMSDGSIDLEKVQTESSELLAKIGSDLQREASLIFPNAAHQAHQVRAAQRARRCAAESEGFNRLDDVIFVMLAEVFLDGLKVAQSQRLGHIQADVLSLPALF